MKKTIIPIAIAATLCATNLFAANDYIIQITEKDGTVREIPVSTLDKVSFETVKPAINFDLTEKAVDAKLEGERIKATQYRLSTKDAEKMMMQYHAKNVEHKHRT